MTKESFIIEGLAGKKTLKGTVSINGAKNAALKAMAAAVLFDDKVTLENIPNTEDIHTLSTILTKLGAEVTWKQGAGSKENGGQKKRTLEIDTTSINSTDIDADLAGAMRASVVLTGPMLGRFGKVTFPSPGGCVIGARPIDLFLAGYQKMGATVREENNCLYVIEAPKGLKGAENFFDKITVGGTETIMMAAVLAKGTTVLRNCAMEPEIVNVAEWLVSCGANIKGVGTPTIVIEGTGGKLLSPKNSYVAIPDRIEAGSFLILGALCADELTIENCRPDHMEADISILRSAGVAIDVGKDYLKISKNGKVDNASWKPLSDLRTHEYPGFSTDLQPQVAVFLTQTSCESKVFETIYEGRFKYVEDLQKMGANITVMNPREILVKGPTPFKQLPDAEELNARDIRAGFAVVMAALVGTGKFTVNNVHLIDRGYEKLEERLKTLGANVKRVSQ